MKNNDVNENDKYAALEAELFGETNENTENASLNGEGSANSSSDEYKGLLITECSDITQSPDGVCDAEEVKKEILESIKKQDEGCDGDYFLLSGEDSEKNTSLALSIAKETGRDLVVLDTENICSIYIAQTAVNMREAVNSLNEYVKEKQRKVVFLINQVDECDSKSAMSDFSRGICDYVGFSLNKKNVITIMTAADGNAVTNEHILCVVTKKLIM